MGTGQDYDGTIGGRRSGDRINLRLLGKLSGRPALYSGMERNFWADPYVSKHVLNAHLDPESEAGSRESTLIDKTVDFLDARFDSPGRLLDLGCGPGLYAEQFAGRGWQVKGIDVSPAAIAYATKQATKRILPATYVLGDFTSEPLGGPYDLVIQIYGEMCTLSPDQRMALLQRVRDSLRPDGLFVFDVFTKEYVSRIRTGNDWYVCDRDGFWAHDRHMVLEQTFHYPEECASVVRYTVIAESGSYRQYSVWWRHFDAEEIRRLVLEAGFSRAELYATVWGDPLEERSAPDGNPGEWIAVVCHA